ncbi:MAG TPA: right-handed parallel beta-helix repeat-containing protein [Candidatus Dormibacteraeota bacterium]|nr:right-handed parallel beta-helix repeat-containing protein [Candidatus Dormibacteraeota bacterium]
MKHKPMPILLSILLILAVLGSTLLFSLSPVFANPVCGATITTNTTLTANIGPCSGNGLIIGANGITLNCAGHTITATTGNTNEGITVKGQTKVTVENCKVTGFYVGIDLYFSSTSNTLTGNTANKNAYYGFSLSGSSSSNNILTRNTANNNAYYGFYLSGSSNNILTKNTANGNTLIGFSLSFSSSNTLSGNTANSNALAGFYLTGSCSENRFTGNTANNDKNFGFALYGGSSNTLTRNTANHNVDGFFFSDSSSNSLTGNTANKNDRGFHLYGSSSNTLTDNTASYNDADGFLLEASSSSNTLTKNTANSNYWGYYDYTVSTSVGVPHWDTANSYGTTKAKLSTTGDTGTGNGFALAGGNADIATATSPF